MKIAFVYPSFSKEGCFPNLPQNRQFRYTRSSEIKLYPVILATAATMLKEDGHQILWLDGVTERLSQREFKKRLSDFQPDLLVMETKAPVLKLHWEFINKLKTQNSKLKTVLLGDHVTYFPEESLKNSKVDFVITGGDYDFVLRDLVRFLEKKGSFPSGVYFREKGKIKNSGPFKLVNNLDQTPIIDRDLTKWFLYGEAYLYHPVAYMMFGRGCGGIGGFPGVCTFCIWQDAFWKRTARLLSPKRVVAEIKNLLNNYPVKEIFDDTDGGPCYDYKWLSEFYQEMQKESLLGKIKISTNSRADVLDDKTCQLLKKLGFRLLKIGLESGSDQTLERINKRESLDQIIQGVKTAKDYGLNCMLTVMVGYPWEDDKDVQQTYQVAKELLLYKTRLGDSLQVSTLVPYPGSPLYHQAIQNSWLKVDPSNYEKFDMSEPVLKTKIDVDFWSKKIWNLHLNPLFITKTLFSIRSLLDIILLFRGVHSLFGHLKDYPAFRKNNAQK